MDIYWFTDNDVCSSFQGGRLLLGLDVNLTAAQCRAPANYGVTVDKMRRLDALDGQRKPIWNFVEVGCPMNNGNCVTGPQIRAAVWHSLIAGARGITYFNHSFSGSCQTQHALRDPCYASQRAAVKATNEQIATLAPALNAPTVTSGVTTSPSVRSMVKWYDGHFYVFAGSRESGSSTGTVSIPCIGNATAVRLGESGTVPVSGGAFSDQFADGNAIHIYRIDGGSRCGL